MERQCAQMNLQHIYSIHPCLKWIILRNSIHGGMGWWYKRPSFFQLFNLFYHQENFAGSTICHENYNWQNLSSSVEEKGVSIPQRQFIHIYHKIPQKSINNKAILHKTKLKKDSNALLKYKLCRKHTFSFLWTFWITHIKILHKAMFLLEIFLTIKVPPFFQKKQKHSNAWRSPCIAKWK